VVPIAAVAFGINLFRLGGARRRYSPPVNADPLGRTARTLEESNTEFELPVSIQVTVSYEGRPLAGMFVRVRISTSKKNDFSEFFGPSDSSGRISLSRADLIQSADRQRKLFVMDYGDPERDYSGAIDISPVDSNAVSRALDAYRKFKAHYEYPPGHADHLRAALLALNQISPALLEVDLSVQGGSGSIIPHHSEV
jgi:hypothetical protein